MFHSNNSLTDSGPWNSSVNLFQRKCLKLPDTAFQTKCQTNSWNSLPQKMFNTIKQFLIKYWLHITRKLIDQTHILFYESLL